MLRPRIGTLEARLALVTSLVLVVTCATLFLELSSRERTKQISAKASAAALLAQLLATGLAPAIESGDVAGVYARLDDLGSNADIVGVAVWEDGAKTPMATRTSAGSSAMTAPTADVVDGVRVSFDRVVVTRTIVGPNGAPVGRLQFVLTLAPENVAFGKDRLQLFGLTSALAMTLAGLLAVLARRYVVGPLGRLAQAATALAEGDLSARVDIRSNDEIGDLARAFNVMGKAVAFREARLTKDIELARRIQTSILPGAIQIPGLEIAATMSPVREVGGDYYDILPVDGGCWFGIGDVAGHGLDAGLVMLMIQSIAASLVVRHPDAAPSEVVCFLNEVLYDNIHNRLRREDHATLTLLHYESRGELTYAGAHEEIIVYRADTRRCEIVPTPGTWVGGRRDIRSGTVDSILRLRAGDVVLLHTDGATETRNGSGAEFGVERLSTELERVGDEAVEIIQEHLLVAVGEWGAPADDATLVVFRYTG